MNLSGKIVIKGEKTPRDEESVSMKLAKKSVIERNKYEKGKKFIKVPILHGYKLVELKD